MHQISIPCWASSSVMKRHGREHVFEDLDPARSALIVVDMQNAFVDPSSSAHVPNAAHLLTPINSLATTLRLRGGVVCFSRHTVDQRLNAQWRRYIDLISPAGHEAAVELLGKGSFGHALHPGLVTEPRDVVVDKTRFSALADRYCTLHHRLRNRSIETVLIAGTLTNVCCESTARDAMMLDYRTIMLSDATAARNDEAHNAALANVYSTFGDVWNSEYAQAAMRK